MTYLLLRLESIIVFFLSLVVYFGYGGTFFGLLLFLLPDISLLGYLKNPRFGAVIYNTAHTYTTPFIVLIISYLTRYDWGILFSLLWAAHIGLDRALGLGLKLETFSNTHLGKITNNAFFINRLRPRKK